MPKIASDGWDGNFCALLDSFFPYSFRCSFRSGLSGQRAKSECPTSTIRITNTKQEMEGETRRIWWGLLLAKDLGGRKVELHVANGVLFAMHQTSPLACKLFFSFESFHLMF